MIDARVEIDHFIRYIIPRGSRALVRYKDGPRLRQVTFGTHAAIPALPQPAPRHSGMGNRLWRWFTQGDGPGA